jgi:2-aminoadipate transaminase
MNYEQFFSDNARHMKRSEIRELLKLIAKPGIISFAGGLPAPDLFPINEIKEICKLVMEREGKSALQYGPTEGDLRLREELSKFMHKDGVHVKPEQITIITSSQQGLDLIAKIFCDPGDIVMTGKPTYVGGIQAFHSYGADMHGIKLDEDGTNTQVLEQEIIKLRNLGKRPKFIYEIPDFQNPSGITMSLQRRRELINIAEKYDLLIVEDSPYRQLRFEGQSEPTIYSLCPERTIGLYTFSKILLPGFRLGWVIGPAEITGKLVTAKQAVDLCSPPFNQAILYTFMNSGQLEKQIDRIIVAYREKRDFMLAKLEEYMPKLPGLKWTRPNGGLFLWVTLPEAMDATEMFISAIEKKVAYVVGTAFHPDSSGQNTFRLNFSYSSMSEIDEGIKRLAGVVSEWTANKGSDTFITP